MHTWSRKIRTLLNASFDAQTLIDCYRMTFNQLLPNPHFQPYHGKREEVVKKLKILFKEFYLFMKILRVNGKIDAQEMLLLQQELKEVVSRHFSSGLVIDFFCNYPIITADKPFRELFTDALGTTLKGYTQNEKEFYIRQYEKLFDTIRCITDFGLHPLINKRVDNQCRFNVILEYRNGRNASTLCLTAIEKAELFNEIVSPFYNQQLMIIDGRKIAPDKQEKLLITVNYYQAEEVELFCLKNKIKDKQSYVHLGYDVTNQVLAEFKMVGKHIPQVVMMPSEKFLDKICSAVATFQLQGQRLSFILDARKQGINREDQYREWFYAFLKGGDYRLAEPESLKETGRVDLRLIDNQRNGYIMEFKGWWNDDCKRICQQLLRYLDDFFIVGIAFVIDHLKDKYIEEEYKRYVESPSNGYIQGSWEEQTFKNSQFVYYKSLHKMEDKIKTIYHIIYRLHVKVT